MNGFGAQDYAATAITAGALAFLIVRRVRAARRKSASACGSCEGCAGASATPPPALLVTIGDPAPPRR